MSKTILITGSTDGLGLQTAKRLVNEGHEVLIHGRSAQKLDEARKELNEKVHSFQADLSNLDEVKALALEIMQQYKHIDVIINNAGVYKTPKTINDDGLDVRFVVNTIAPYLLTKTLMPILNQDSRVVNLSSAAQAPVSIDAIYGKVTLGDSEAYAQSKLALTMWTNHLANVHAQDVGVMVSVNPASFLGSKMVKEAYGMEGKDLNIGVDILCRAALGDEFKDANGKYFDNDSGQFANPHPEGLDVTKCEAVVEAMESIITQE